MCYSAVELPVGEGRVESAGLLLKVFINYSAGAFCLCWDVSELGTVWVLQTASAHTGWIDVFLTYSV